MCFKTFYLSISLSHNYLSWFLNTPPYTDLYLTHSVWLFLNQETERFQLGPALRLLPSQLIAPQVTPALERGWSLLLCYFGVRTWWGLGSWGYEGWSSGEKPRWNTWRWSSSLIVGLGLRVASWLIRGLSSQALGLDPWWLLSSAWQQSSQLWGHCSIWSLGALYQIRGGCECMRERDPIPWAPSLASTVLKDLFCCQTSPGMGIISSGNCNSLMILCPIREHP